MRALAKARPEHPPLEQIQLRARSERYTDGVVEATRIHGESATAEALEAMIVGLIGLLDRLVGEDMALRLIEGSLPVSERGKKFSDSRPEEV